MYLFCISCKQIVATIKVPTLVSVKQPIKLDRVITVIQYKRRRDDSTVTMLVMQ